jgi:diaminopimelate epimerase
MQDVTGVDHTSETSILNTGSPHYVKWVEDAAITNVFSDGCAVRNEAQFSPSGINVNFVQRMDDGSLYVRTYERGVEDETLSCGTGVTAAAIAASQNKTGSFETAIKTPGGSLKVSFRKDSPASAQEVVLTGPATFVFSGVIDL